MNSTRHMLLTAALASSLTLAACTDEAQDPPSPSSSGTVGESSPAGETSPSGSPSTEPTDTGPSDDPSSSASPPDAGAWPSPSSPAPSSSSSAAPSPPGGGSPSPSDGASSPSEDAAGLPPMPPVAKENSEEGAEAFARWYVETLNHLYQHPQTGILDKYAGDNCKRCHRFADVVAGFVEDGHRAESPPFSIKETKSSIRHGSKVEFILGVDQKPVPIVDGSGKGVDSMKDQSDLGLVFDLGPGEPWLITDLLVQVESLSPAGSR